MVRTGSDSARISITAVNQGRELTAHLLLKAHSANKAQINRTKLNTPRELLGVVRSVLFAPEDLALVRGEPAERRRYLDNIIATRTPRLAGVKADYDKVLRQRNALLKSASGTLRRGYQDADGAGALATLDVWDSQLSGLGAQIIAARRSVASQLAEHIDGAYVAIAPESRLVQVDYSSTVPAEGSDPEVLEAAMLAELGRIRQREIDRGTSLVGPHRDDLLLKLGDQPVKGFASHGETWSFALALRLAEFGLLRSDGTDPVLILDDVFSELDAGRREKLVTLAAAAEQVLITAAVDGDLPVSLADSPKTPVNRYVIEVKDEQQGRISVLEQERIDG